MVGLVARFGEFEAEVGICVITKGDPSKDEVAAGEAGD
jgi:hypothetical protein